MEPWGEWRILEWTTVADAPTTSAVYQVSIVRDGGIRRLLGDDAEGILYVGKSGNLSRRLGRFLRGIQFGKGHSGSNIVAQMDQARKEFFRGQIANRGYRYRYVEVAGADPEDLEQEALKGYLNGFG